MPFGPRRHDLDPTRRRVCAKVRELRLSRHWTQADLAGRLCVSQSRFSQIERGEGSFTAEQLIEVLRLFNVPLDQFVPPPNPDAELQNAFARLGALHLRESPDVLPSARYAAVRDALREVLLSPDSPRLVAALAPVLVWNIESVDLDHAWLDLASVGRERRLGWVVDNTYEALRDPSLRPPREWGFRHRIANVSLGEFLSRHQAIGRTKAGGPDSFHDRLDHFDSGIASKKTLEQLVHASSVVSKRWSVASAMQVGDFVDALRAAHECN